MQSSIWSLWYPLKKHPSTSYFLLSSCYCSHRPLPFFIILKSPPFLYCNSNCPFSIATTGTMATVVVKFSRPTAAMPIFLAFRNNKHTVILLCTVVWAVFVMEDNFAVAVAATHLISTVFCFFKFDQTGKSLNHLRFRRFVSFWANDF